MMKQLIVIRRIRFRYTILIRYRYLIRHRGFGKLISTNPLFVAKLRSQRPLCVFGYTFAYLDYGIPMQ